MGPIVGFCKIIESCVRPRALWTVIYPHGVANLLDMSRAGFVVINCCFQVELKSQILQKYFQY